MPRRSTGLSTSSNKRFQLVRSSKLTKLLIPLVLPRVKVTKVLFKDSVPRSSRERLTEVSERLPVLVLGIPLPSNGRSPELVNKVITHVPKSTRRSTVLVLVKSAVLPTMPPLLLMQLRRTSPPWVVSPTTVRLPKITSSSEVKLWEPRSEQSSSVSLSSQPHATG